MRSLLNSGIVCSDAYSLFICVCYINAWGNSDNETCFQSFCWQLVQSCWESLLLSWQCLGFKRFQMLVPLLFKIQRRVGVFLDCVQNFYNTFKNKSYCTGCVLVLKVPWCNYLQDCFWPEISFNGKISFLIEDLKNESQGVIEFLSVEMIQQGLGN